MNRIFYVDQRDVFSEPFALNLDHRIYQYRMFTIY